MGAFQVTEAVRQRRPLKVAIDGPSGAGKTFTSLRLAFDMRRRGVGKRIAVLDSENNSATLYAGVAIDGEVWKYDHCPIPREKQNPGGYIEAYEYLVGRGYDIIIPDSLTHAWYGAQAIVDQQAGPNRDNFRAWAQVTPVQRRMMATLTDDRAHLIGTMRVKSEYVKQFNEKRGREEMRRVGTKTDQKEGAEYEFDCVIRIEPGEDKREHVARVEKVRGCSAMDGQAAVNPGPEFWAPLLDWYLSGEPSEPAVDRHRRKLAAAETEAVLRDAWLATPLDLQRQLAAVKDKRKAELAAGRRGIPPAAGSAPVDRERFYADVATASAGLGSTVPVLLRAFDFPDTLDRLTDEQLVNFLDRLHLEIDQKGDGRAN